MPRLFESQVTGLGVAAALLLVAIASPAAAQQQAGGRMRVLVPNFEVTGKSKAGEKIADRLKKQINEMGTHAPADDKEVKAAAKKFGLNEKELTCVQYQQMISGGHVNADLVLCGSIDEATNTVNAKFHTKESRSFEVPQFVMQNEDQAAQQVVQAFRTYARQLELVVFCNDYIQSQNWQSALDNCNQAVELNPGSEDAHYMRGSALNELGKTEEALAAYQKVLELNPLNQDAMLHAGIIAAKLGRPDVSQKYFHEYLALNPGDVEVRLKIASDLSNAGDPGGALKLIEEAAGAADATLTMVMYAGHFATNAALQKMQQSPAASPAEMDPEAQALFRTAARHYEALLARSDKPEPDQLRQVLQRLVVAYTNLGDNEKALATGERATRDAPTDASLWFAYANALREAKRYDEAMAALDRVLQIDAEFANVQRSRALMLIDQGQPVEASAAIKAAAARGEIDAAQAESLGQQMAAEGFKLVQARRHEQALPYFRAARDIGKSDRTIGMANFFEGYSNLLQVEPLIGKDVARPSVAQATRAKPLLARAKTLLESAGGYTDQAANRANMLQQVQQFTEVADALIKAGGR